MGHGPTGADPASDPEAYTWVDAVHNAAHVSDDNDEYQSVLTPDAAGTRAYAYRFSGDGGETWAVCDLDGLDNGVSLDQLGSLEILAE